MDFFEKTKKPCDPVERINRAEDKERQLKQACFDFAIRVLKGESANPQETAILPEVLKFLGGD